MREKMAPRQQGLLDWDREARGMMTPTEAERVMLLLAQLLLSVATEPQCKTEVPDEDD